MLTRREFLDTLAVGGGRPGNQFDRQELRPDSRVQRPFEFRSHRPAFPRLCPSFRLEGQ